MRGQENEQQSQPETKAEAPTKPIVVPDASVMRAIFDDWIKISRDEKTASQAGDERKERREQFDLAAQEEMARWAFWMFIIACAQFVVGGVTLGFLYLTFREAQRTADAARDGVREAVRSANAAEDSLTKVQRPYLFVYGVKGLWTPTDAGDVHIPYTVANYGQTPAIIESIEVSISLANKKPEPPEEVLEDHPLVLLPLIEAREKREGLSAESRALADSGTRIVDVLQDGGGGVVGIVPKIPEGLELYFWVLIKYRGAFTSGHEVSACWIYNEWIQQFRRYGSENEYNYTR